MTEVSSTKRSKAPLLLFVAFAVPVLLAKLALDNDWFNRAATNKGTLLETPLSLAPIQPALSPKWRILYRLPEQCDQACENAIYSLNQVWVALGKHQDRAEAMVIASPQSDGKQLSELSAHDTIALLQLDEQIVNQVFNPAPVDGIFISDTLGNVILRYPLQQEQQQAVMDSRDILSDLRKLLKLSRIG